MSESVLLRSTRGVEQEVEFRLIAQGDACRVHSEVRICGRLPVTGPSLLTPVSSLVARRWMDSQIAKLRRNTARFESATDSQCASIADNPLILIQSFFDQILAEGVNE
jgi:hypothetical protein